MSISERIRFMVQHYQPDVYWRMRDYVQNSFGKGSKAKRYWYIFRIKRMEAFANASTGIRFDNGSARFAGRPDLPHGLNGIFIAPGTVIGHGVRICHQVTIGNDYVSADHVPTIGDHVLIYPGAKIIGKIKIGSNSVIGANAVVVSDVPEHSIVVVEKPRVICKE